ncbi:MAG: hypothetical protein KAJ95_00525 [Gammaproteobacteria bacterium]|nr:hypothetical protein [Gammaproteobacteria bacterium]
MILDKLILPIPLMLACSITSSSFAYDEPTQNLPVSSWSAVTHFTASSLADNSDYHLDRDWFDDSPAGGSSLLQINRLDTGLNEANQWTVDIKRRLFTIKENTYIAMGLGWNDVAMEGEINSGMRFVAEGRVGLFGPTYLFGQAALSPWMTNSNSNNIVPFGKELELGVAISPLPSMSFKAGYRSYWLDSTSLSDESISSSQADGFYLGGGFHW